MKAVRRGSWQPIFTSCWRIWSTPHWLILKAPELGSWTADKVERLFHCGVTLLGNVIVRLIVEWEHWPWPFRKLFDDSVSDDVKDCIRHAFARTCFWCRSSNLSPPFYAQAGRWDAIIAMRNDNHELQLIWKMLNRCRVSNQRSELQLGRLSKSCSYRVGSYLKDSQLSARHFALEQASRWASVVGKVVVTASQSVNVVQCTVQRHKSMDAFLHETQEVHWWQHEVCIPSMEPDLSC